MYAVNPLQVARYRERHGVAGAKSDPGELAEIVRLDRSRPCRVADDSTVAEGVRLAARAHQTMIWTRQRSVNTLRSLLREFYPAASAVFGGDLAGRDALAVLAAAPNPDRGRAPHPGPGQCPADEGGPRNATSTDAPVTLWPALRAEQLTA